MFTLDIHCHFFPRAFLDMARQTNNPFHARIELGPEGEERLICAGDFNHPLTPDFYDAERMLRDMDARQVDMAAISAAPPTLAYWADASSATALAMQMNESISERVYTHSKRLLGLATVPLQDVDASIREAHRAIKDLGLHGFQIGSNVNGHNLDAPELFPFFQTVEQLNVPIFVHPYIPAGSERMRNYYLHNLIGMVAETGIAIASMIFGGIIEHLPGLKLCFAHAGGVYPYIVGRHDHGYRVREKECREVIPYPPSHYMSAIFFDSVTHHPLALRYLVDLVGSDRIIIGSDYPFDMGPEQPIDVVKKNPYLSEGEKAEICGLNALSFFGLQ